MRKNSSRILFAILLVSAALRLYGLVRGDTVNDEVFTAFRAIGMLDFDAAPEQTTPLEWLDPVRPWWTHLSFHDHPPLSFLIQHIFIRIFGEHTFAFRLPSAILGALSVYLLYLVGARLFSRGAGLIAAALYGITVNGVYISRVGMQEAYVIFFLLLAAHCFLKSLEKNATLVWTGVAIGLGLLTKYTAAVAIPIFLTYLLIFRREYFRRNTFWLGALAAFLIASPVIVYNLKLYQTAGHFDFQLSSLFGERPEQWRVMPGKEIGTLSERVRSFAPRLVASHSWLFLAFFAASLLAALGKLTRGPRAVRPQGAFLAITMGWLAILLLAIGPSYRFLTMLTPFMALAAGIFAESLRTNYTRTKTGMIIFSGAAALLALFEIGYTINNQIRYYPVGPPPWVSSHIRRENRNLGYQALNDFLANELRGRMPALTFDVRYRFLEELRERALAEGTKQGLIPYPALIVNAATLEGPARLWVLDRYHIYHAWPILSARTYAQYLNDEGADYYARAGFKAYYLITSPDTTPSPPLQPLMQGEITIIRDPEGRETFKIFKSSRK